MKLIIGCCVVIVAFFIAHCLFNSKKDVLSELGQLGDFYGGILGTIVSAITLLYLIYTVDEMRKQNQLIIKQNEHNSFIMLLHNYHEIINDLDSIKTSEGGANVTLSGREAIELILSEKNEELENLKHIVESAIIILNFPGKSEGSDIELDKRREENQKNFNATLSAIEKKAILKIRSYTSNETNLDDQFNAFIKTLNK